MKISNFKFYNPVKLIAGDKALGSLPYELKQLGSQRPLIITDQGVREAGLINLVKESLAGKDDINCAIYDRVPPDSSPAVVNSAAGVFRQENCDAIIAVGGGSVIDTGKAVNIVVSEGVDDIIELKGAKLKKSMRPFISSSSRPPPVPARKLPMQPCSGMPNAVQNYYLLPIICFPIPLCLIPA
jgi:alcohol dehydrogenase